MLSLQSPSCVLVLTQEHNNERYHFIPYSCWDVKSFFALVSLRPCALARSALRGPGTARAWNVSVRNLYFAICPGTSALAYAQLAQRPRHLKV